ncbi:MAG: hypothetical protein JO036_18675 [Candidatus Eremiobacteraeota bacterium]|nr:hypothetical protein [Candidatus Eremiobacteraeota bacterium]
MDDGDSASNQPGDDTVDERYHLPAPTPPAPDSKDEERDADLERYKTSWEERNLERRQAQEAYVKLYAEIELQRDKNSTEIQREYLKRGYALGISGLAAMLVSLIILLVFVNTNKTTVDVVALLGTITTFVGTMTGGYFGIMAISAGKAQSDSERQRLLSQNMQLAAALSPSDARPLVGAPDF